jgi:hypothetical protein
VIAEHAMEKPTAAGKFSFGDLLGTTLKGGGQQQVFLNAYIRHEGPIEAGHFVTVTLKVSHDGKHRSRTPVRIRPARRWT